MRLPITQTFQVDTWYIYSIPYLGDVMVFLNVVLTLRGAYVFQPTTLLGISRTISS